MELTILITIAGALLVLGVTLDIWLTIYHRDFDGPIMNLSQACTWKFVVLISRNFCFLRRSLLSFAGPLAMAVSFASWLATFILGWTLVYWPFISDAFRADTQISRPLGFFDALYYSGGTATVLGFGDVTPLTKGLKSLAFIEAALGFTLLTGVITYLLNVLSGYTDRNIFTRRLFTETGGSGRGVDIVLRYLNDGNLWDLKLVIKELDESFRSVLERSHQLPVLDLIYRSKDPKLDPEIMLVVMSDLVIALHVYKALGGNNELRTYTENLERTLLSVQDMYANQHLSKDDFRAITNPQPLTIDHRTFEAIHSQIRTISTSGTVTVTKDQNRALELICRQRILMDQLNHITGWKMDGVY